MSQSNRKNHVRLSTEDRIFDIITIVISVLIVIVVLYPMYFVVIASFSDPVQVQNGNTWLIPKGVSLEAYKMVFEDESIWRGYYNTIIYTAGAAAFSLLVVMPAAYALSRKDFVLRGPLNFYFLIVMFFSGGLIPTYLQVRNLGLLDTYWVMVIPFSVNVYHLIVARTFFSSSIPAELREAAEIDGCSNTRFFLQIVLPLSKAIIAVIGLYVAVGCWNGYFNALIYLNDVDKKPLQNILRGILLKSQVELGGGWDEIMRKTEMLKYALIVISSVPIMAVYPFIQKYFAKGVMIGSLKG